MRGRRLLSVVPVLVLVLGAALAQPASAAPQRELRELTGSFQVISCTPLTERTVGGGRVVLSEHRLQSLVRGGPTSTAPKQERSRCVTVRGTLRCHGVVTFTGTVDGLDGVGTVTSRLQLTCDTTTGRCTGATVAVRSTGALAGLHGRTTFVSDHVTGAGTCTSVLTAPWDD